MTSKQNVFEEKFLRELKILKLKSIRSWHRFDKEYGVSRFTKKMALALGLKLIALAAPQAQISLHAQNVIKKNPVQLLAKAAEAKASLDYLDFMEMHKELIEQRQKDFALSLWENMQENIYTVQESEKIGHRSKTLKDMFQDYKKYGIKIDNAYFCASAGMGSLMQTVEDKQFDEYKLLFECLTNPNSCKEIIKDFKKNFGTVKESRDIQKSLAEIYQKNPYAVCIVFSRSPTNSRSGYHYLTVFSNKVAVDSIITDTDTLKGKTARFNRTTISNTEDYFVKGRNRGYVFNVSEMIGNYQIFELYQNFIEEKKKLIMLPTQNLELVPPFSMKPEAKAVPFTQPHRLSWRAVGISPIRQQQIIHARQQSRLS